jgi:hypothetical protein
MVPTEIVHRVVHRLPYGRPIRVREWRSLAALRPQSGQGGLPALVRRLPLHGPQHVALHRNPLCLSRLPELGKVGAIDVSDQQVRHCGTHLAIRRLGAEYV